MDAPVLLAPTAETPVRGTQATLRWAPVAGARAYHVQVAADADFSTLVVDNRLGAETALHVRCLAPGDEGRLYWRVAARGGPYASSSFRLEAAPAAPPSEDRRARTALAVGVALSLVAAVLAFVLMPTHTETAARQARADSLATVADSAAATAK